MSHLYFTKSVSGTKAVLCEEDAAHLARVLRAAVGDRVLLCDGCGTAYEAELSLVSPGAVEAEILSSAPSESEPSVAVTLYIGLAKGDKMEWIVQKATELGAAQIVPFESCFCIAKQKNEDKKRERYARIAREATKQCARGRVPSVRTPISYETLLDEVKHYDVSFLF
ncbi:MAG: RsmE family RNA methyltransferase [Pygmaiobacter sp.]